MAKWWKRYLNNLQGGVCFCGQGKASGKPFCYVCTSWLPKELTVDPKKRIGDGYEPAYDKAVEYLKETCGVQGEVD